MASSGPVLRMKDVAAYLDLSHQRVSQLYAEGKLPEPDAKDPAGRAGSPRRSNDGRTGSGGGPGVGGVLLLGPNHDRLL